MVLDWEALQSDWDDLPIVHCENRKKGGGGEGREKMKVRRKTKNWPFQCETPMKSALPKRNLGNLGKLDFCFFAQKHAKIGAIRSKTLLLDLGSFKKKNKVIGSNYVPPTGQHVQQAL